MTQSIAQMVRSKDSIDSIGAAFDALDHRGRLAAMYELTAADQSALFELATGRACVLDGDFVPKGKAPLSEVIHWGINSLPTFRKFQKRFTWPSIDQHPRVAVGYNEQTMKPFTGPGFFTARTATFPPGPLDSTPTVVIDYTVLPAEKAAAWPPIIPNNARFGRFVYNGTMDWMWKVSKNVSIGRARRESGWMDNWFVLCRED